MMYSTAACPCTTNSSNPLTRSRTIRAPDRGLRALNLTVMVRRCTAAVFALVGVARAFHVRGPVNIAATQRRELSHVVSVGDPMTVRQLKSSATDTPVVATNEQEKGDGPLDWNKQVLCIYASSPCSQPLGLVRLSAEPPIVLS